jgi:hypothetical protein
MMGAISTPLDVLINDEVDKLPAENKEWSEGRIAHSDLRTEINLSAGYTPGAGIDLLFQNGTQHKWRVDCSQRGCLKEICLEETFPDCIGENPSPHGDRFVRVCPKCKRPLDVVGRGRWIATFPQLAKQRKFSYRISALSMTAMSADYIWKRWNNSKLKKTKKAKFNCSMLAIPDAGAMQPFSEEALNKMQSGEVKRLSLGRSGLPRFAGIDAGDTYHFVCYERVPGVSNPHLVYVEQIDSDDAVQRISELIGMLGVVKLVADKKPHTNTVRALAYRFPRIVALQDFLNGSPLKVIEEEHEGKRYECAKVDRDESIDEMASDFTSEQFLRIPEIESDPALAIFASQLQQLRKERTFDAKKRPVDRYVGKVENHYGMALNSAHIAEQLAPAMPFSFTSIERDAPSSDEPVRRGRTFTRGTTRMING